MPKLKLVYFDFDGGRGEPARLALHIGGVDFEDQRIAGSDWPKHRDEMPFRAMPVLYVDGRAIAQSNTILRYVGRLAGMYPKDVLQAALCDEAMDAAEEIGSRIGATIGLEGEARMTARQKLAGDDIPRYLEQLQARLVTAGGEWFADGRMTVADLKVWQLIRWLRTGVLDDIPRDLPDQTSPALVAHAKSVAEHPKVAAYYAARKKK